MLNRFSVLVLLSLVSIACVCLQREAQPKRPESVMGWHEEKLAGGVEIKGELLLKKGESSDNGRIGVKVVEIIPGDPCAHPGPLKSRRVTLQFYRPSDHHIFCEDEFMESMNSSVKCSTDSNLSVVAAKAINSKEGWVLMQLF